MDRAGNTIIRPHFQEAGDFKEGAVRVKYEGCWGFIDPDANILVPLEYQDAKDFSEGLAPVKTKRLWGYVDKEALLKIKPQFKAANEFHDERAIVELAAGRTFIRPDGKVIMEPLKQRTLYDISEGRGRVVTESHWYWVDKEGKRIEPS